MPEVDRRRFLQLTGGSAALSVLTPVDRARGVDPGVPPRRLPRRRRAHRRPDAGEPLLRPLLRHHARRARVRRPAPGRCCRNGKSVWRQPREERRRRCCRSGPTSTTSASPSSRTSTTSGTASTRRSPAGNHDRWVPAKGTPATMAHLRRSDIPFHYALADAFTRLRLLPLQHARPDRPEPLLPVDAAGSGNDGKGGGPVINNVERGATTGRPTPSGCRRPGRDLEDLPGHSATGSTRRTAGVGRPRPLHRQLRRQRRCSTSRTTRTPCPATRSSSAPGRAPTWPRPPARPSSTSSPTDVHDRQPAAGLLDRRARGLQRAPELAGQLRRLVRLEGARRAHQQPRRLGEDRAVPDLRRERRLLRPRGPAVPERRRR